MPAIINTIHDVRDGYTVVPNELINDGEISANAKGVYCYLASKPTGWKFYIDEVRKHFTKPISGAIKELEEHRWLFRQTVPVKGQGKGFDWVWIVALKPFTDEQLESFSTTRASNSPSDFAMIVDTPGHNKTDLDSKPDLYSKPEILTESIAAVDNVVKVKKGYGEFGKVRLTADEYQKLEAIYGSNLESAIALLDDYLARSNKRYASHYAVMKRNGWVYNEIMKAVPKNEAGDLDLRSW